MSGHTPGPWEVRSYDKDHQRGLHGIFRVGSQLPIVEAVWGRNIHESDANARLIAAAPELLDLLQREPAEGHTKRWQDARKAAIAKATA